MNLSEFFTMPALIMFMLGVLLAGSVVSFLHNAKASVTA